MVEVIGPDDVRSGLPWPLLVRALRDGFAHAGVRVPQRHHHDLGAPGDALPPTLLLMPAWNESYVGVKVVGVFPDNPAAGIETVTGSYLLMSGSHGVPVAVVDGGELTARRTAAASVLAATYLAREDSATLLVVGAGRIARNLADAYRSMFPIDRILVWNHRPEGAGQLAALLRDDGGAAEATGDLAAACGVADIVTCATLATRPVVRGSWLAPGTHLDLVGGFTPGMREADDDAVRRAAVYVDGFAGALAEAGDIIQPLASGALTNDAIVGDLFGLAGGTTPPRRRSDEITMFKSVGHALEDLVAAATLHESRGG